MTRASIFLLLISLRAFKESFSFSTTVSISVMDIFFAAHSFTTFSRLDLESSTEKQSRLTATIPRLISGRFFIFSLPFCSARSKHPGHVFCENVCLKGCRECLHAGHRASRYRMPSWRPSPGSGRLKRPLRATFPR